MKVFNALLIGSILMQQHIPINSAYAQIELATVQEAASNALFPPKTVFSVVSGYFRSGKKENLRPWENRTGDLFYEQEFVQSQEFQNLSQSEQTEKLASIFEKRKWRKEIISKFTSVVLTASVLAAGLSLKYGWDKYFEKSGLTNASFNEKIQNLAGKALEVLNKQAGRSPVIGFTVGYLGTVLLLVGGVKAYQKGFISKITNSPWDSAVFGYNLIIGKRAYGPYEALELEYFIKKSQLPNALQKYIEFNLEKLNSSRTMDNQDKVEQSIKSALSLYDNTSPRSQLALDKFDQEFRGYHKNVYDAYRMFYVSAAIGNSDNVIVQLLRGEPGTGKTVSVEKFARVLNGHVIKISGSDSLEKLFGSAEDPGVLVSQMAAANDGRPMILFIDEFDRGSPNIEALLKILDTSKKTYFNNYYQCELPLPNLRIVAGNRGIDDKALLNRVDIVEYTGFTKQYKKQVLLERLTNQLNELSKNGTYTMGISELNAEDHAVIDQIVAQDKDIGFRTSEKILYRFAAHLIDKKYHPDVEKPDFVSILKQQNQHLNADFIK